MRGRQSKTAPSPRYSGRRLWWTDKNVVLRRMMTGKCGTGKCSLETWRIFPFSCPPSSCPPERKWGGLAVASVPASCQPRVGMRSDIGRRQGCFSAASTGLSDIDNCVGCIEPAVCVVHQRSSSVGQRRTLRIAACRWRRCTMSCVGCIEPAVCVVHQRSSSVGQRRTLRIAACRWRRCTMSEGELNISYSKSPVPSPAGLKCQTPDQTLADIDGTIRFICFSGRSAARATARTVLVGTESSPRSVSYRTAGGFVRTATGRPRSKKLSRTDWAAR